MPIDPNVLTPTLIKPISVAGVVHDAAVVQEAQARAQAYRDKQMEVAQDRQENEQIRGILQQSGGQLDDQTFAAIRQVSVPKAMDIEKLHNDSVKSSFEIDNSKIDHDLKVLNYTSRQLAGITDQHSYDMARAGIKATTGQDLPEQYDPALVQSWQEKGMTYAEKLNQQREDRAAKFQELTATRQQQTADLAERREDRTAKVQDEQLAVSKGHLAVAQGQLRLAAQKRADDLTKGVEGVKLPAATAQVVAGLEQSESILKELQQVQGKDAWLGPIAGRKAELALSIPGMSVPDDQARFIAQTATLKNAVIKAITGAQMSEPEAARIMKQVPDLTDKPNVWKEKAAASLDNVVRMRQRILQLSGANPNPSDAAGGGGGSKKFTILSVK